MEGPNPYIFSQQMAYVFEKFPWLVVDEATREPRNNVILDDDGRISEEESTLLRDEPNDQFLSTFRLHTEEVKNRKRKADKSGPEVEATLNIDEVNIVTFWSMRDPCRNLEEGECARNPLCEFRSGACRKKLTKEAIDVYVNRQIRAQTRYLNAIRESYELQGQVQVQDVVDCWLCNLHPVVNGIQGLLKAAENRVRKIIQQEREEEEFDVEEFGVCMYAMALGVDRDEIKSISTTVTWDVESDVVIVQDESGNKYRAISDLGENGDFEAALVSHGGYEDGEEGYEDGGEEDSVGGYEDGEEEDSVGDGEEEDSVGGEEDGEEKDGEEKVDEDGGVGDFDDDFPFDVSENDDDFRDFLPDLTAE